MISFTDEVANYFYLTRLTTAESVKHELSIKTRTFLLSLLGEYYSFPDTDLYC